MAIPSNPILISALTNTAVTVEDADNLLIDQGGIHKKITGLAFKNSLLTTWSIEGGGPNIFYTAGSVGIGIAAPLHNLHVFGGIALFDTTNVGIGIVPVTPLHVKGSLSISAAATTERAAIFQSANTTVYEANSSTAVHRFDFRGQGQRVSMARLSNGSLRMILTLLETTDPGVVGALWNNAGVVNISL